MDEPNSIGILPDAADEHSAVMTMLASESWQKRLEEARKAREALLARRGVTQDLPTRLKAADPRLSGLSLGQTSGMPIPFPSLPDLADVKDPDDEEEFPEFFPEPEDHFPAVQQRPAAVPHPWAHVPPVGPAQTADVALPAKAKVLAAAPAPRGRTVRVATGFSLGLLAGIAATSVVWMMRGPTEGSTPQADTAAMSSPAVVPQTRAPSPPNATAPIIGVSTASRPPEVAFALGTSGVQPVQSLNDSGLQKITPLTRLAGPSDLPLNVAPSATNARHVPDMAQPLRPTLQVDVPTVSLAALPEIEAHRPAAFPRPTPQSATSAVGTGRPDPTPRAIDPAPAEPQIALADPAGGFATSAGGPEQPRIAPPATPSLDPHQVNVLAPESVPEADLTATIARLKEGGFSLGEDDRVSFRVSKSHVRFYHAGDRAVAERIAARIGGDARDFTTSDINPPEGMIEVWLAGTGPKVAAAKPVKKADRAQTARAAPKERAAPSEDAVLKNLRDKIVRQLQNGEHL